MKKELTELDKIDVSNIKRMFYKDFDNLTVLTKKEERILIKESQEGNMKATNKLIVHNLKLVRGIALKYKKAGLDELDLIEEGILGLYVAIKNFDLNRKEKLSTYATPNITSYIQKFAQKNTKATKMSWHGNTIINKFNKFINEYKKEYGRLPSRSEVAKALNIKEKKVRELEVTSLNSISLETYIDEDEEKTIKDNVADSTYNPEELVVNKLTKESLKNLLNIIRGMNTLSEREKDILLYKCGYTTGKELTFEEIAKIYGVRRQRINQIHSKAIKKILLSKEAEKLAYLTDNPEAALKLIKEARKNR